MAEQGKNKRRQLEVEDTIHNKILSVDSQEEVDFTNWLCEAVNLSIISDFQYQPESFQLFENTKYETVDGKSRTLFQEHKYSPDYVVVFDPNSQKALSKELKVQRSQLSSQEVSAFIDVKGTFNRTSRSFSTDRKWVWEKFKVYICELIPVKFFKLFGCPMKSFYTKKSKKARKQFSGFKSLKEMFSLK